MVIKEGSAWNEGPHWSVACSSHSPMISALATWIIRSKTSRDRAGWNTLPVTWRGGNDQQLGITSACFWNGDVTLPMVLRIREAMVLQEVELEEK